MSGFTVWFEQDALRLSVEDWISLLKNPAIFDAEAKELLRFIYHQPEHTASATDAGESLGVSQQKVTSKNRSISRKIYELYNTEIPGNDSGGNRYWNVMFDGVPEKTHDAKGHFRWKIRANLVLAIEAMGDIV